METFLSNRGWPALFHDSVMQAINNVRTFQDSHRRKKNGNWEKLHGGGYLESLEWLYSTRGEIYMQLANLDPDMVIDKLESEGVIPAFIMRQREMGLLPR